MPELPEVEGARRLAERTCVGKRIVEAIIADDEKVICNVKPQELQAALVGRTIVAAKRRGKQMWWELDAGPSLLLHFGMTGGLVVKGIGAAHYKSFVIDDSAWPPRFCKIELKLEDGTQVAFCDSRRFAKVRFLEDPEGRPPISELGWDPLLNMPALEAFQAALAGQRRAIKALLLDQSFSAGIGNWVADEVLYQSRVHPEQPANTIPADQVAALHAAIRDVCRLASEVEADADRFPLDWLFHYRWGKGNGQKSKMPSGQAIEHLTVGGRTSAVVPAVQKLNKAAIAAAGKAAAGGKKAAGGGRKKKAAVAAEEGQEGTAAEAAAPEQEGGPAEAAVAAAAAEAAVAVAQGSAKPRGRRGSKAAQAQEAADAAAEVAEAAAEVAEAAAQLQGKAKRGRGSQKALAKPSGSAPSAPAASAAATTKAAAAGRRAKSFRGQQQQSAPAAAAERKRKAPADKAAGTEGSAEAAVTRRTRARS
ncbi:formamidopyrimidine-DNA glycosylase isoform X2 [Chlorella sorokiniana]|uniref:Formamidopyrimidine-DNA glycosylase isoform X2 n=1 Tax=Chlorella sorokiniana TaxID=3076 RepID=A0A2P6TC37_CHLSO|nr:formamidopyrimidine-DNA glycosylase isoform X2 [Chlorella sorokiniana]|eukprot:PRW20199.1 formamidopyrimidine-DNA glycosylase isoform X2 [Chlorella sorokiniana]